jgi:DNA-binding NtrC family response regulator
MARYSILYFDDEQRLLDIFQETFSDTYEVRTATTLAAARGILADCTIDIIISDQMMPEIEGARFLHEAATLCPDSFRMMLTGQVAVGEMLAEISSGIIQLFVVKPWQEEHLREVLERASTALDLRRRRERS